MTRERKSVRSERGQGGSVVVNADNLSQERPLAALYRNLQRKSGVTGRYFLAFSLLVSLTCLVRLYCQQFTLFYSSFKMCLFEVLFYHLFSFLSISFPLFTFPFLSFHFHFPFLSFLSTFILVLLYIYSNFHVNYSVAPFCS